MKSRVLAVMLFLFLLSPSSTQLKGQPSWSPCAGNPLLGYAISPTVLFDSASNTYRMWFISLGAGVKYAESPDGVTWTVSDTVVLPAGGPGSFDPQIHALAVVRYADSLAMYYTASTDGVSLVIGRAVSNDGKHWVKSPNTPVLTHGAPGSWESVGVGANSVVLKNGVFIMSFGATDGTYVTSGIAESQNGIVWSKYAGNPVLPHGGPGSYDERESAIMGLTWKDTLAYAIFESIDAAGHQSFSLATSADGKQWKKYAGNPVYVPRGGWDTYGIGNGSLLRQDSVFKYWYTGYSGSSWSIGLAYMQNPGITLVSPGTLNFDWVRVNSADTLALAIKNIGTGDSLRIFSITSDNSHFTALSEPGVIAPAESLVVSVRYVPTANQPDSGLITIATSDPGRSNTLVPVKGHGYALTNAPAINSVTLVPNTYYQARIIWFRGSADSLGAADPVTQYSIWRLVRGATAQGTATRPGSLDIPSSTLIDPAWDFIATVPAAGMLRYAYIAPVLFDYAHPYAWTTYMVAGHTKNLAVYQSAPDSVQYDPPNVSAVTHASGQAPRLFTLHQNYPNPFNPSTTIRYDVPRAAFVSLSVYSVLGQEVARLVNGVEEAGYHEARFDASGLASGIYFYRMKAGDFVKTMKLVLTR
ncbi:MAG TPA: T9SS type A sorting domain-containing protein [Bacteroidota bacterium]|nr:T9SS type A sorting domain-containing protein [Bacteroidota bacterium]